VRLRWALYAERERRKYTGRKKQSGESNWVDLDVEDRIGANRKIGCEDVDGIQLGYS
jgi:hypothetical protein